MTSNTISVETGKYQSMTLSVRDIPILFRFTLTNPIARAPNGYWKGKPDTEKKNKKKDQKAREWHDGPPRVGTFSMRATRFRLGAGCLSWEKKDGTTAKNERILDIIPAQYKDPGVNSTKGWRDLNKAEKKRIKDGAMKNPQQGPKAKRAAQAEKEKAEKEGANECSVEGEDLLNDEEMIVHGDKDAWIGASNPEENGVFLGFDPEGFESTTPPSQVYHMDPLSSNLGQSTSVVDENSLTTKNEPTGLDSIQPRKRSTYVLDADSEEAGSLRAQKRIRVTVDAQDPGQKKDTSLIPTSSMARQRQREPVSSPYAAGGTLSPTTRSMTSSNYLDSRPQPSRHQSEISHRNNGVNPPIQIQREDAGADVPEFGLQVQGPSNYEYPTLGTPGPSPPMHRVAWQGRPRDQPSGQIQSQRMPLAPKTTGKRKRADGSKNENVEGQSPMKQTKRHMRKPAPAPTLQGPFESVPGADMYTPEYWQVSTQSAIFPHLVNSLPGSFRTLLPFAHGALWNGRGGPVGGFEPMPPIKTQQWMPNDLTTGSQDIDPYLQAHDFIHFDPELHPSPGGNVHAPPDFHLGQ